MIRRFVNLVSENYKTGVYSLHRVDVSKHLFHQSRADARVVLVLPFLAAGDSCSAGSSGDDEQPTTTLLDRLKELPEPCVKIQPSFRNVPTIEKLPFWGFLSPRSSEDKFLCMNWMGDTVLCHADNPSVDPMPHLREKVGMKPILFTVARPDAQEEEEEDLYVIHNVPNRRRGATNTSCFAVFTKDKDAANNGGCGWRWESLPPPPFVRDPLYDPGRFMYSYTLVDGGRTLCFSCATPGIGTYYFDTVERQWRHAGDWRLQFVGGAEYVPDLALWLGFSRCTPSYYLCGTSDLLNGSMSMADRPPELEYVWQDIVTPENWFAGRTKLVSLGSGRFCIARAFVVQNRRTGKCGEEWWEFEGDVTVLTGIEIEMGRDDDDDESRLKVWRHKSLQLNSSSRFSVKRVL